MSRALPLIRTSSSSSSSSRPSPHASSSSPSLSPSLYRSLSSLLHRLEAPCQMVSSSALPLQKRRAQLKELMAALRSSPSVLLALALSSQHPSLPLSFPAVIDAVLRLVAAERQAASQAKATTDTWEALRFVVEASERHAHLLVSDEADLVAPLIKELRHLLSGADATKAEVCAPAATHVLAAVLSHGPYIERMSLSSLTFFFDLFSLAYCAALATKDAAAFHAFVGNATRAGRSLLSSSPVPPASLQRLGNVCGEVLSSLVEHWPSPVTAAWEERVFPFLATVVALESPDDATSNAGSPAFSHAHFAGLLLSITTALERHHHLLFTPTLLHLPPIVARLVSSWPQRQSPSTLQRVKRSAARLIGFAFSLQLLHPHVPLSIPLAPLVRLCLMELRQPQLFAMAGTEVGHVDILSSSPGYSMTLDEGTQRFIRLCVDVLSYHEWRDGGHGESQRDAPLKEERMEDDDEKLSRASSARSPSPALDVGGPAKRRKECHRELATSPPLTSPLLQVLTSFAAITAPTPSHFFFVYVLASSFASSSFFFSSPARLAVTVDLLRQLLRWAKRGKTLNVSLWSLACLGALGRACREHRERWDDSDGMRSAWKDVCTAIVQTLVHDEKRVLSHHALSLLASLLYADLVPSSLFPSFLPLLTHLPGARPAGAAVKQESEEADAADGAAPMFATPSTECDAVVLRFITACFSRLPASSLPSPPPEPSALGGTVSVDARGGGSLYGMLLSWVLRAPADLSNSPEWSSAAVLFVLNAGPPPPSLRSFLSSHSSWSEVHLLPPLSEQSSLASGQVTDLDPTSVDYDDPDAMEAFIESAEFTRLIPLPRSTAGPPPARAPLSASHAALLGAHVYLQLTELLQRYTQPVEEMSTASQVVCMQHLLRFLHILLPLPASEAIAALLRSLLAQFAAVLSHVVVSPSSLPRLLSTLQLYARLWRSFPEAFAATENATAIHDALCSVSGALQHLFCSLLVHASNRYPVSAMDDERRVGDDGSSPSNEQLVDADGGGSNDFAMSTDDRPHDLSSADTMTLCSFPAYQPTLRVLYHLLLSSLKADVPLEETGYARMREHTESTSSPPWLLPVLFLLSLHDAVVRHSNLSLLLALQRLCDLSAAAPSDPSKVRPTAARHKRGRDDVEGDSDDTLADGVVGHGGGVECAAFFLRLCECVRGGWIELGQQATDGAEMGEEDMVKGYTTTVLQNLFPASGPSSIPASLSALLRCLCSLYGLDAGLLMSWSLPTSLFSIFTTEPSMSSRAILSITLSSCMQRTTDVDKLWSSSSERLLHSLEDLTSQQVALYADSDTVNARRCDEAIWVTLGSLCALSHHRLAWERTVLLRMCRLYAEGMEEGRWVVLTLLQQMSEALGYDLVSSCPPSFLPPPARDAAAEAQRPSLFTTPSGSLMEEHVDFLLMEWASSPDRDLTDFPFVLLRASTGPASSRESNAFLAVAEPSLSSSLVRYMPQVLSACLLHLPAQEQTLLSLPGLVDNSLPALLTMHFPAVFASCYALYSGSSSTPPLSKAIIALLKRHLTDKVFTHLFHSHTPQLIARLLTLVTLAPQHAALPSYTEDDFTKSLIQLSRQRDKDGVLSPGEWLCRGGEGCCMPLLLHVRTRLYSEYREERQWRWVGVLRRLMDVLDGCLAKGYVLRLLLDTLIGMLDESADRFKDRDGGAHVSVDLIAHLLQRVLTLAWHGLPTGQDSAKGTTAHTDMSSDELGRHVRYATLMLVRYATTEDTQAIVRPVLRAIRDLIPPSHTVFERLTVLDAHPCVTGLVPRADAASLSSLLSSCLLCFDDLSAHIDTSCMLPLVEALLTQLQRRKTERGAAILDFVSDARSTNGSGPQVQEDASLPRFLAVLLCLCKTASSPALRDLCGQCLGEVGVIEALRIEQRHVRLFQPGVLPPPPVASSSSPTLPSLFSPAVARWYHLGGGVDLYPARIVPASVNPAFHQLHHYHHYLLYLLSFCLRSSSLLQQHLAFVTLTALFTSDTQPLMHTAYQQLSSDVQLYLAPFELEGANRRAHRGDEDKERVMALRAELSSSPAEDETIRAVTATLDLTATGLSPAQWSVRGKTPAAWLTQLVSALLRTSVTDPALQRLKDVALFDADLALKLLPQAVVDIIMTEVVEWIAQLAACVVVAVDDCLDLARQGEAVLSFLAPLLHALQYAREQLLLLHRQPVPAPPRMPGATAPSSLEAAASATAPAPPRPHLGLMLALTSFFHQLNPLSLAEAACCLRWYGYALQWLEHIKEQHDGVEANAGSGLHPIKRRRSGSQQPVTEARPRLHRYHSLLLRVYRSFDDPDGLHGALQSMPHTLSSSLSSDLILAEHDRDWTTALTIHDMSAEPAGISRALKHLQCHHLLASYSQLNPQAHTQEQQMETAWRNAQWDLPAPATSAAAAAEGFHQHLYAAMTALRTSSSPAAALSGARRVLVASVTELTPELVQDVVPLLVQFRMLADVSSPSFETFEMRDAPPMADAFELLEPLLALHSTLQSIRETPLHSVVDHLCHASSLARQAAYPLIAAHYVRLAALRLRDQPAAESRLDLQVQVCHAEMLYGRGGVEAAIRELRGVLGRLEEQDTDERKRDGGQHLVRLDVDVNAHLGEWMSESHSESTERIGRYFVRALASAESLSQSASSASSSSSASSTAALSTLSSSSVLPAPSRYAVGAHHFALGSFHDRQFAALLARRQSTEWQARRAHFTRQAESIADDKKKLQTPDALAVLSAKDPTNQCFMDLRKLQRLLQTREREHEMDSREYAQLDAAYTSHLDAAIAHYQSCLASSSQHDTFALYRFCALWFNHDRYSPITASKMANMARFAQLPSYKFIPLIYQIASRLLPIPAKTAPAAAALPDTERLFRKHVTMLLYRLAMDHPHHCLYPLFALSAGGQVERVAGSFNSAFESNNERIAAATHLIAQLKQQKKDNGDPRRTALRDLICAQERLIAAYVELGNRKYRKEERHVALKDTMLDRLSRKEMALVAVPTLTIPVSPSGQYPASSVPSIVRFETPLVFANAGINKPLILHLLCSDGRHHKQLLKPSDDLRQDAVMEQLFSLVNTLLATSKATRSRHMRMRTYNVVPLTPGVGLVEWVVNTRSLHDCLVSSVEGAHPRYHPPSDTSWSYHHCLVRMRDCTERSELLARYREVCAHFPPALRRYFLEQFPSSSSWYAARLTFMHSLSTTSIIGYLVGLGDRHIQNILLDSSTSEVITIDLGVAFDMGRLLKTPELVPFRLTRDLVDGMGGVGGLEGGYRRGCEEVLRVMRSAAAMVVVLLEVFVYDPLFRWSLPPNKVQQLRPEAAKPGDKSPDAAAVGLGGLAAPLGVGGMSGVDGSPLVSGDGSGVQMNPGAFRALTSVKQRLSGEDGMLGGSSRLSVEGQVSALIQQATSEENLSQMYWGWSAFV